jgi:cyclophilin family peptidyl-prolyl cis-trans isomerase
MRRTARLASLAFAALVPLAVLGQAAAPAAAPAPGAAAKPAAAPVRVKLTTTDGVIVLELYPDKAPISVANFVQYVKDKHYDGTIFHRVIPTFMIQGGGFTPKFDQKKTRAPIKLEAGNGLTNVRGSVAMARTNELDSATAQFFINVVDNSAAKGPRNLDTMGGGYAVFGMVVEGMDVVDKIRDIPTGPGGPFSKDVPFRNAVIQKAELLPAPKAAKPAEKTP